MHIVERSVPDPDPNLDPDPPVHMFLGLPDLDSDPLVTGMDPDPFIKLLSSSKNSKKNLDSHCFVTFGLFIFEKLWKCTFKK